MKLSYAACALAAVATVSAAGCRRGQAPPPPGPVEVSAVAVHSERVVLTTELPGRTAAYLIAEIRPQVNGIIRQRLFVEGSDVKAGSLLYQIDPAPYEAAYEQAKAALAVAEANLPPVRLRAERLKGLVEIHAVGQQDYDDAAAALLRGEASVASARAAVESARINLGYTPIRAPISGRIGRSAVTVGALVTAYQPTELAVIQKLDPIYVDVTQASADLLRLRRDLASGELKSSGSHRKVKLLLEDGTPYAHEGKLQFRDVTVDSTTGSVVLRVVFPNPGTALVVGPESKVEERALTLDRAIDDRWLVSAGLADGDQVIVEGLQRIRPGVPVKAVPFVPGPAGPGPAGPPVAR
jgi:membrane fusion protein (multidrug efflux system)